MIVLTNLRIRAALALAVLGVAATGCGGAQLEELQGEPASVKPHTVPVSRRTHPAVDGCQRFVAAMRRGDVAAAWGQLSGDTRAALVKRAQLAGLKGQDLLLLKKLPRATDKGTALDQAADFDPVAVFALGDLKTLQLVATAPDDRNIAQDLEIGDAAGHKRRVAMRFEGYAWTLHDPSLGGL